MKKTIIAILLIFLVILTNSILNIIEKISFGYENISYFLYFTVLYFTIFKIFVPFIRHYKTPSVKIINKLYNNDKKAIKKMTKFYYKRYNDRDLLEAYNNKNLSRCRKIILKTIKKDLNSFDCIINKYALSVTTTVAISPNSLIDGFMVIINNIRMINELSKKIGLRHELESLAKLYLNVFLASTITGALEEYEEVIEDIVEEILEFTAETNGIEILNNSSFLGILTNSISPLLQASGNYFFITYNGYCYKNYLKHLTENKDVNFKLVKKEARREARKKRMLFLRKVPKKLISKILNKLKDEGAKKSKSGFNKIKDIKNKILKKFR